MPDVRLGSVARGSSKLAGYVTKPEGHPAVAWRDCDPRGSSAWVTSCVARPTGSPRPAEPRSAADAWRRIETFFAEHLAS